MALSNREACRMVRRLLLLQVLLNHRTMQGGGYLFTLWPWLRRHPHRERLVPLAGNYMNAHPVFGSLAAGALRRRLEDMDEAAATAEIESWQRMLCGPLGVAGDSLIWDRWKPLVFGAGAMLLLLWPDQVVWQAIAVGALIVYNAPLAWLRYWGIREGYRLGDAVLDALSRPAFRRWQGRLSAAGAMLSGLLLSAGIVINARPDMLPAVQFLLAAGISFVGIRRHWDIMGTLLAAVTAAMLIPPLLHLVTSVY